MTPTVEAMTAEGYCLLFNVESVDGRLVEPGRISISPKLSCDIRHLDSTNFGSAAQGNVEAWIDGDFGVAFRVDLPRNAAGFDVRNGLATNGALAVSNLMMVPADAEHFDEGLGLDITTAGELERISFLDPGAAAYSQTRSWLAGSRPSVFDPVWCNLHRRYESSATQRAAAGRQQEGEARLARRKSASLPRRPAPQAFARGPMRYAMTWPQFQAAARALGISC